MDTALSVILRFAASWAEVSHGRSPCIQSRLSVVTACYGKLFCRPSACCIRGGQQCQRFMPAGRRAGSLDLLRVSGSPDKQGSLDCGYVLMLRSEMLLRVSGALSVHLSHMPPGATDLLHPVQYTSGCFWSQMWSEAGFLARKYPLYDTSKAQSLG